eukprot:COSAG04_NODE_4166_length_2260_cov_1.220268_1_plen_73_part_10
MAEVQTGSPRPPVAKPVTLAALDAAEVWIPPGPINRLAVIPNQAFAESAQQPSLDFLECLAKPLTHIPAGSIT